MKKYIIDYYEYFGLHPEADIIWDEYEYIVNNRLVKADNVHHIQHGANKYEHINNYIALSYSNHELAHQEKLGHRDQIQDVHFQFLEDNPY